MLALDFNTLEQGDHAPAPEQLDMASGQRHFPSSAVFPAMKPIWILGLIAALWPLSSGSAGEPYLPEDDSVVLEQLPTTLYGRDQFALVRQRIAEDPKNVTLATAAANSYLKTGKSTGDPRYFGYARAALRHWWEVAEPPLAIARCRAAIKEQDHDFDGAAADLRLMLSLDPKDEQAHVDLANNYRIQGKYREAASVTEQLAGLGSEFSQAICKSPLLAVTGSAEEAYQLIESQMSFARDRRPGAVPWMLVVQAEAARILGKIDLAEKHYRKAIASPGQNSYARRAYGEFLLERERPKEALAILGEPGNDNGALLLATIAAKRSGDLSRAREWQSVLAERFHDHLLRGGQPHGRFYSRFLLELEDHPTAALEVAQVNWARQKEFSDSRALLAAALELRDRKAARPVIDFLKQSGTEDADLQILVRQLESL